MRIMDYSITPSLLINAIFIIEYHQYTKKIEQYSSPKLHCTLSSSFFLTRSTFEIVKYILVAIQNKIWKINTIKCLEHRAHGHQTFSQILGNSCNVGFVKVGMALGKGTYFKYLHDFGFGQLTGIDLKIGRAHV